MSTLKSHSLTFLISQWSSNNNEEPIEPSLEWKEDLTKLRNVCCGKNCRLDYDNDQLIYKPSGSCSRSTFCTETKIMKDSLFLKEGQVSETINSINFGIQLKTWQ